MCTVPISLKLLNWRQLRYQYRCLLSICLFTIKSFAALSCLVVGLLLLPPQDQIALKTEAEIYFQRVLIKAIRMWSMHASEVLLFFVVEYIEEVLVILVKTPVYFVSKKSISWCSRFLHLCICCWRFQWPNSLYDQLDADHLDFEDRSIFLKTSTQYFHSNNAFHR